MAVRPNASKSGPSTTRSAVLNARVTPDTLARVVAARVHAALRVQSGVV